MNIVTNIYKKITFSIVIWGIIAFQFYVFQLSKNIGLILFSTIIILSFYLLKLFIHAIRTLPGKISLHSLWLGLFIIIGGACFDVISTLFHTPDLRQEANPFIQFFIKINSSTYQLYIIGLLGQFCYISVISLYWASFLKSYPLALKEIPHMSLPKTIPFLLNGKNGTWISLIVGKLDYFYCINSIFPVFVALSFYRWYLGLEWIGYVPISRVIVPGMLLFIAFLIYIGRSYQIIRSNHKNLSPQFM